MQAKNLAAQAKTLTDERHALGAFIAKLTADNIGLLAGFVSWSILTSMVPIVVGVVALCGLFLQTPSVEHAVVQELSNALQGVLSPEEIRTMVQTATSRTGLLAIVGFVGLLWGSANVGGAISTACQAIFEVRGRPFLKQKLIDFGMLFILTATMLLVVSGSLASAFLDDLLGVSLPTGVQFMIGTTIGLAAGFLLFASIYAVFPNIEARYKQGNVWRGALLAAGMLQIVSYMWPIYVRLSHFSRYSAFLFSVLVLTAWIYFFAMILMIGAEVVAVSAIRKAQRLGASVGPLPERTVPQHLVLRRGPHEPPRRGARGFYDATHAREVEETADNHGSRHMLARSDGAIPHPLLLCGLFALLVMVTTLAAASRLLIRSESRGTGELDPAPLPATVAFPHLGWVFPTVDGVIVGAWERVWCRRPRRSP